MKHTSNKLANNFYMEIYFIFLHKYNIRDICAKEINKYKIISTFEISLKNVYNFNRHISQTSY